ncbi:hypothetical protein Syn7803C34_52 [Synechococcus phage ACG-2014f]|uniref:Uncharacterized protein n=1 Tax=Synechococcus phage ACG-2014f TaxID=1493511 RepID=A0A0E3FKU2_9CAUD|nr:hypothetical protein Syn7803US17_52 [Synechococcus phage ACG-2014f]AIX28619.1 hypothetical protein Syn7803US24_52 [Synechococcus phage ACG-2014f]AIX30241.1 hypothetical protein Syn7803US36_53 [Synechococcus phage ACG-2014f]AIX32253.1 hypothetical protein Syn7803US44_53 [Synechococcus phage ACG-2014f]AIX45603.1 hypothetical protein Syn7803C34_52 [Synechococcus phage ACG-2014f]
MFSSIFSDNTLQDYINQNIKDPWVGTPFEGYVFMSPKQKGEFGERFVSKFMTLAGCNVKRAKTSTSGHDRLIDGILTEIKFGVAIRDKKDGVCVDGFIINHVSVGKDWERLIFCGINPDEDDVRFVFITKEDFESHLKSDDCLFNVQQGGKKVGNDDYICTKVSELLQTNIVRPIDQW